MLKESIIEREFELNSNNLMFILFMNYFSRCSKLLFSILFADDTILIIEGKEYHKMIFELNIQLIKVSKWLKANKLTLNLSKTHFMVFNRARIKHVNDFVVNIDKKIDSTLTTKFLGIIIDNKLK